MTSEREIKWLHSHGADNKDPNYDLGGDPSKFEISELPANNLFDDIKPEETVADRADYRCFYIVNKYQDTDYDVTLNSTAAVCTDVFVGSVVQSEEQKITFQGPSPSDEGYFIIQLDWGPELTIYWSGSYGNMAADMQSKIQLLQYCSGVTVTASAIFPSDTGAEFTVTFDGPLQNRKMGLIQIVQNNLVQSATREYRVDNAGAGIGTWNYEGASAVQVHTTIQPGVPLESTIHIPYPYNDTFISTSWPYMHLSYTSYSGQIFNLSGVIPPIPVPHDPDDPVIPPRLGNNDEVWVDMPDPQPVNVVNVSRIKEGSPINQLAQVIEVETQMPLMWTPQGASFHVGLIKPLEGFFVWVKRVVVDSSGCADKFSITLDATKVS